MEAQDFNKYNGNSPGYYDKNGDFIFYELNWYCSTNKIIHHNEKEFKNCKNCNNMGEKKGRTLVIGDIHGGFKCLLQVLERSKFDITKDKLIFLGDYVDGWSQSSELIQFLITLKKESTVEPIFLKGNHDENFIKWLNKKGNEKSRFKYEEGNGKSTIESYRRTNYIESPEHKEFFNNLKSYHIDEENRGFVHGGFTSKLGIGHEPFESNYYYDRDLWILAILQHGKSSDGSEESLKKMRRFDHHKEIFIGHTTTQNWNVKINMPEYSQSKQKTMGEITVPMNRCNVWNMDTGAGFNGPLSIMDINTKKVWQSDNADDIYANERGRNKKSRNEKNKSKSS